MTARHPRTECHVTNVHVHYDPPDLSEATATARRLAEKLRLVSIALTATVATLRGVADKHDTQ